MKQVMVRQKLQNGMNLILRGEVLSERDGVLRVKMEGQRLPVEIQAKDTIPAGSLFNSPNPQPGAPLTVRAYPSSPHALVNRLR